MSRPLKTPSMRWEFAFCSSGYVLVLLYTLGALGLNCEREQRWRRFRNTAAAPRTPLSLVLVEAPPSRPSLGRKDQGGGCAAPRGAAPEPLRLRGLRPGAAPVTRAIRARDPGAGASPPAAAVVVAGEWVGCGDRCGALRSMRSRVAYRVWLRRSRAVASSRGPGVL